MRSKKDYIIALNISVLLIHLSTMAQMYVGSNTFVYTSNQFVYIKQDLELKETTSNFYLRNDGQLLQGAIGPSTNKGIGNLSVFQEGTVNNFQYNYWCSPVGNTLSSTATNNPFGIKQLGTPISITETTPAIILASNIYDGTASPLRIAPYWVSKFINKTTFSDWVRVESASTLAPGEGFTMKGSSGTNSTTINGVQNNPDGFNQRYDFRGKPNDGTISIPVLAGELSLTGNPYPSTINLQNFLISETNCTGIAYFWQQDKTSNSHFIADYKGGYATYSGSNIYVPAPFFKYDGSGKPITQINDVATIYPRKYAPIGQGFLIKGLIKGNVQMKNSNRLFKTEDNSLRYEKRSNEKTSNTDTTSLIRFNTMLNNGPISQTVLAFNPLSTDGIDRYMDASSQNDYPANVNFLISNKEYVINSLAFDSNKKIAIGFRSTSPANYKITVNQILNLPEVINVYLHDKTTDIYYDIKNSFYELNLAAGTTNTRYEITFKNNTLGVDEITKNNFIMIQNNIEKILTIQNPFQKEISNYSIYDITGKLIANKNNLGNELSYLFPTSNLTTGIYIVKITSIDKLEEGLKIIIQN
ncbi:T9SS type A sorting domain-containing protein [Flavobacterium sp.]|uniref:T9SS type A sorting domain-containing protein n=1 Tax=Flavobacterium sp. TaxID=239 RepID=UPI0038FCBDA4